MLILIEKEANRAINDFVDLNAKYKDLDFDDNKIELDLS